MQEDPKLKEVAKEIGEEIMAGKEEISLDQPFPEELEDTPAVNNKSPAISTEDTPKENTDNSQLSQSGQHDNAKEADKPKTSKTRSKARIHGHEVDKLVLLFVVIGLIICIFGILLSLMVGLLAGVIWLSFGVLIILLSVFAPLGY